MVVDPKITLSHFYKAAHAKEQRRRYRDGVKPLAKPHLLDLEWREAFDAQKKAGIRPILKIKDAASRYRDTILSKTLHSPNHQRTWRNNILRFMDVVGENTLVHEITEAHLSEYRDALVMRGLKNNSVNRSMDSVNVLFSCCRDNWRIIETAPRLQAFKKERRLRYISTDEEALLLKYAPLKLARLIRFILGTGARKSEALNLCWQYVSLPPKKNARAWVHFPKTKNGKAHAVPLPPSIKLMLQEMKKERYGEMPYVFTFIPRHDYRLSDGRLLLAQGIPAPYFWPDPDFRRVREKADLLDVTLHDLRHTYASRLVMNGVPIFHVAKLLNHSTLEETLKYAHLSFGDVEDCVDVLDTIRSAHGGGSGGVITRVTYEATKTDSTVVRKRVRNKARVKRMVRLTKQLQTGASQRSGRETRR